MGDEKRTRKNYREPCRQRQNQRGKHVRDEGGLDRNSNASCGKTESWELLKSVRSLPIIPLEMRYTNGRRGRQGTGSCGLPGVGNMKGRATGVANSPGSDQYKDGGTAGGWSFVPEILQRGIAPKSDFAVRGMGQREQNLADSHLRQSTLKFICGRMRLEKTVKK